MSRGSRPALAATLALVPFLALVAAEWPAQPDLWYSDFAQYVEHARALADGRPYTDTGYIFVQKADAWAPRAYPPGLPIALAPVAWLFRGNIAAIKAWMIVLSAASVVVAGAWFWRRLGPLPGLGVIALVGLSPQWVSLSVSPLSDVVFVGAVWAFLLVADREEEWSWRRVAAATALMGAAIAVRPHGLVLLPALVVWGLLRRSRVGNRVFVPALVAAVALAAARVALPAGSFRTPRPGHMIRQLVTWDPRYHFAIFDSHLYPLPGNIPNDVYHAATFGLMLLGLWWLFRRLGPALPLVFAGFYVLALGSFDAGDARYAFPLYPLFVFGMLNGVCRLWAWRDPRRAGRVALALAALLAAAGVARGVTAPRAPRVLDDPDYRGVVEWVARTRAASAATPRLAFFRPRVLAWETDVEAMPLLSWPYTEGHYEEWCLRDIDYVVLGSVGERMGGRRLEMTATAISERPDAFEEAYRNEAFTAYRIRREVLCQASPATPPADSSGRTPP